MDPNIEMYFEMSMGVLGTGVQGPEWGGWEWLEEGHAEARMGGGYMGPEWGQVGRECEWGGAAK